MIRHVCYLFVFLALNVNAHSQLNVLKTWPELSKMMNRPASVMRATLLNERYIYQFEKSQERFDMISTVDTAKSRRYDHPNVGVTADAYVYLVKDGTVAGAGFSFLPFNGVSFYSTALDEYLAFKASILTNGFLEVGLLESDEVETRFYENRSTGLTIKMQKMLRSGKVKGVNVFVYRNDTGVDEEIILEAKEYLRSNPGKAGRYEKTYDLTSVNVLADSLNRWTSATVIGYKTPYRIGSVSKVDGAQSSLQFVVKNNKLHMRLTLPSNATCDSGVKEIPVRFAGTSGIADESFYLCFEHSYTCSEKVSDPIYVTFRRLNDAQMSAVRKAIEKCCW